MTVRAQLSIRKYLAWLLSTKDIGFVGGRQTRVDDERAERHAEIVFNQAIKERFNTIISGGISSGKT